MSYFYAHNSVSNCLKWRPRLKIWKSGSLQWNPETQEAWSYNWCFAKRINGKMVFNEYRYSNTTTRHQWEMRGFLKDHKIKIDLTIDTQKSLTHGDAGLTALHNALRLVATDHAPMDYARNIAKIFRLKLTKAMLENTIETMEIEACNAYLNRAFDYAEDKIQRVLSRLDAPRYIPTVSNDSNTNNEVFPCAA